MTLDLVVVHSPVGGGHKSAALAIAEDARARGLSVEVLDTFEHAPAVLGRAYVTAHLTWTGLAPDLYGSAYFNSNHRLGKLEPVRRAADHVAWAGLVKRVVQLAPRAVVATHHLPLVVLGRARRKGWLESPLVGVVTDYGAHAVWAEKGLDGLCVPGAPAHRDMVDQGIARSRLHVTGIPVRRAFESIAPGADPAPGEPLRVLVTSGGFGVGPVGDIVRSFAGARDVELTVVCGRAGGVERRVRAMLGGGLRARVIGFEKDMPARVAEADIVVGKAGGLTVSEAMTAGRPMVIAGAVPGNETINADLVARAGAGVIAAPGDVGPVVSALRAADLIGAMGANARALVVHDAARRVVDVALDLAAAQQSKHAA